VEGISKLFEFDLEILHEEKDSWPLREDIPASKMLGKAVSIEISQKDGGGRMFNGMVCAFSQSGRSNEFGHYWIKVVPAFWIYTQNHKSRIFQQKSVPSIIKEVFQDHENLIVWEVDYQYKPRNYCVQYRESDFDFASRLMEEEGIYYFFEHTPDGKHKMIISDKPRFSRDCPRKADIAYFDLGGRADVDSVVLAWNTDYKLQTGQVSFRDHHMQQPGKTLAVTNPTKFAFGDNTEWEIYDYPGDYAVKFDGIGPEGNERSDLESVIPDGKRTAELAMAVIDAKHRLGDGESDCSSFTAGHRFRMTNHPIGHVNGEYVLTSITHTARQWPPYIGEEIEDGAEYRNSFQALIHGRAGAPPFRPERITPKPTIYGSQTASVVTAGDEEIYTDKYGRIKVQFHWDREGQTDGSDSCWVHVAQSWAGNGWGSMFIPRVGMEVLVHFLEGNPDRPIVTGCVYHPMNMPPYPLPDEKTKSTIKTYSTKGGGGFNEFRFEDKKDSEQIFIHGEKDLDIRIKNDRREFTGNDQHLIVKKVLREMIEEDTHLTVKGDHFEAITKDRHLKVSGKESVEITGSKSLKVSSDVNTSINGNESEEVTGTMYLKAMNVIIEGMTQVSLKVGGNFIDINPGGIFIQGTMVMINSGGAAGNGTAPVIVPPTAPKEPDPADDAKPGTKTQLEKQSLERKKKKPAEKDEPTSWIDLKMVDEEGNPVPGQSYEVTEADGTVHNGSLDHQGKAHVTLLKPGNCKVSFPDLDKGAWEDA
jgi:type VI secretion system secreted protein VgrG